MRAFYPFLAVFTLALTACASTPKPPPIEQPAAKAVDPRLCAAIEPEPDIAGGIVQPVTDVEREAVARFLDAELDVRSWGVRGWSRADLARKALCP